MDSMALCECCVSIENSINFAKKSRYLQIRITINGDIYEIQSTFVIVITTENSFKIKCYNTAVNMLSLFF